MSETYETKLIKIDRNLLAEGAASELAKLEAPAAAIKNGELVAFPTETVYGLGGNAEDPTASSRIYAAKGRPSDNPLIVHIADIRDFGRVADDIPEEAVRFAERFWPGPLTIIVNRDSAIPKETTGGLDTVAVRFPDDIIAQTLIKKSGCFIAAPSANKSGRPSTTRAEHCMEDLEGKIPYILDGGAVKIGLESTIVDCTNYVAGVLVPQILRPGKITLEELREIVPETEYDPAIADVIKKAADDNAQGGKNDDSGSERGADRRDTGALKESGNKAAGKDGTAEKTDLTENVIVSGLRPKAPGMKYRHYAPKGEFTIFEGEPDAVIKRINEECEKQSALGRKTAVLATEESKDFYKADYVLSLGRRTDESEIAAHLFETLREFDELGAENIYGESFNAEGVGRAIMNRLMKAAGYNVVRLSENGADE